MKNKTTAGLLAFFLGGSGAHRFYLGQVWLGIFYLLLLPTTIPIFIGIIDAIALIAMSQEKFNSKYNNNIVNSKQVDDLREENLNATASFEKEKNELNSLITSLIQQRDSLSKYQGVVDAEFKANEILSEAKYNAEVTMLSASKRLEIATIESQNTIDSANKRAEEIAGDAYKALQNVDVLEKAAQAIKNLINGYGNEYVIPTFNLLDDLAEEFGHTEAGEELRKARERTRLMAKNEVAAQCDYVEMNRKITAINFVLDAFNGKVDSILATIKKDNFGILKQKIKDAYSVVNYNGKAFRNAVITPEYLQARQDELKWAVVAHELKLQEREEQRMIKEQIREEERARREFEKAIRDTEREEELLRKAIEKAQKEVEQASEVQKEKYEAKLSELNERLKMAEEKNQRALSMAQQTKSGNVYIISNIGSFGENVYKIGMTRRLEPLDRVRELGDASVPFEFDVHSMIYSNDAPALERELHKKFLLLQVNKVNPRKEFFRVSLTDIKTEIDKMGLDIKWTMKADAKQYRESLAIEQAMQTGNFNREDWVKYQNKLAEEIIIEEEDLVES